MDATQIISCKILTLVADGMNVTEACKVVLGEDTVDEMITSFFSKSFRRELKNPHIYEGCRAKATT